MINPGYIEFHENELYAMVHCCNVLYKRYEGAFKTMELLEELRERFPDVYKRRGVTAYRWFISIVFRNGALKDWVLVRKQGITKKKQAFYNPTKDVQATYSYLDKVMGRWIKERKAA